jgi:shikimate 5-dehydrogenase
MLLKRAAAEGLETIPGVEMFIEQAARQFEIFTGDSAPRTVMQQAAREALAEQSNHSSAHG